MTNSEFSIEVAAELAAHIKTARENYERWQRTCPVCGVGFTLAGDVTPRAYDTCSPECALEWERINDLR